MKPLLELRQVPLRRHLNLHCFFLFGFLLTGMLLELLNISSVCDLALLFLFLNLLFVHGLYLFEVLLEQFLAMLNVLAFHLTQVSPLVHNLLIMYFCFLFDDLELQLLFLFDLGNLGLLFLKQIFAMVFHVLKHLFCLFLGLKVSMKSLLLSLHLLDNVGIALHRAMRYFR